MIFECPKCGKENDIDEMPECACDDMEWECPDCGYETTVGWYAIAEER